MPRSYTMTQAARDARAKGGRATLNSPDGLIKRLVASAPAPTPEQAAKLRNWLAAAPETESADS